MELDELERSRSPPGVSSTTAALMLLIMNTEQQLEVRDALSCDITRVAPARDYPWTDTGGCGGGSPESRQCCARVVGRTCVSLEVLVRGTGAESEHSFLVPSFSHATLSSELEGALGCTQGTVTALTDAHPTERVAHNATVMTLFSLV